MLSIHSPFQWRITILRWVVSLILGALAVFYEIGPGRWIHDRYSNSAYFDIDIVFYGLVVPALIFITLTLLSRWLDQKEQAEKQARAVERRLASIMLASADAIITLNLQGCIDSWNRGAELLFGYTIREIQGCSFSDLLNRGDAGQVEFDWLLNAVEQTGFIRDHETTGRDSGGREIAIELTATHITAEDGQVQGISVILRDVTERKHREAEIHRLNAKLNEQVSEQTHELARKVEQLARANVGLQKLDQTRTEFISVVSHQLRAPLTNIRGAFERMEDDCPLISPTCGRMFVILDQQAKRLDRLVQDVLNTAQIESGQLALLPEPISVVPVVQQVVEQIRARSGRRTFEFLPKPGLPLAFADRDRMAEVLINLLDNADKYSPPGREVIIDLRADQVEIAFSVRDFGKGIPVDDLTRIFEKFYRTDSSDSQAAYGYGLGLYICRRLVEAHGGRIWAENSPSGGAIFSFTIPVAL